MKLEIWKEVAEFEGQYSISSLGRVLSLKSNKIMKQSETRGYMTVGFSLGQRGKVKRFSIHRLVALAFIENPHSKPQVNHIDGNKKNNDVSNLEWSTAKENIGHAFENNLRDLDILRKNGKSNSIKIKMIDKESGDIVTVWDSISHASRELGFDKGAIHKVVIGVKKSYKGYLWAKA